MIRPNPKNNVSHLNINAFHKNLYFLDKGRNYKDN